MSEVQSTTTTEAVNTEPAHWENYWVEERATDRTDASELARQNMRDIYGYNIQEEGVEEKDLKHVFGLIDTVAGIGLYGTVEDEKVEYVVDPRATANAAKELYLKLGPDNSMKGSGQFLLALAGRVLNAYSTKPIVSEEAYQHDFIAETIDEEVVGSQIGIELLTNLSAPVDPEKGTGLDEFLTSIPSKELLLVCDMLTDSAEAIDSPGIRLALENKCLKMLANIEGRVDKGEKQANAKCRAVGMRYDIKFAKSQRAETSVANYDQLMVHYANELSEVIKNATNGTQFEVFVPLLARHIFAEQDNLNLLSVSLSTLRSDAPHDMRSRKDRNEVLLNKVPKRSSDIAVRHRGSKAKHELQLKADFLDHSSEYDPKFVTIFKAGLDRILAQLPDQALRDRILEVDEAGNPNSTANYFIQQVIETVTGEIGRVAKKSPQASNPHDLDFRRKYGITAARALEIMKDAFKEQLSASQPEKIAVPA